MVTLVVSAVKAKNVVTLAVDGVGTYPGIGEAGISNTDTKDPLYVGGIPDKGKSRAGHWGIQGRIHCIPSLR